MLENLPIEIIKEINKHLNAISCYNLKLTNKFFNNNIKFNISEKEIIRKKNINI